MKNITLLSILLFVFNFLPNVNAQTYVAEYPNLSGTDFNGNTFDLYSDLDNGKRVIVFYWGIECNPCKLSLPYLQSLWEEHGPSGDNTLVIYGFNDQLFDADSDIQSIIDEYNLTFPIISNTYMANPPAWFDYSGLPSYNVICSDKSGEYFGGFSYPHSILWWESILDGCSTGTNHNYDLGLLSSADTEPKICGDDFTYVPKVIISNSGSTTVENYTVKTYNNGVLINTNIYTGTSADYQVFDYSIVELLLDPVLVSSGDSLSFEVVCANDQVSNNNTNFVIIDPAPEFIPTSQSTTLILEMSSVSGAIDPSFVNLQVLRNELPDPNIPLSNAEFFALPAMGTSLTMTLPEGSCYKLEFLTGMSSSNGTYVLKDNTGHVLWTVGDLGWQSGDGLTHSQRNKRYSRYFNVSSSPLGVEEHLSTSVIVLKSVYYNLIGQEIRVEDIKNAIGIFIRKDIWSDGSITTEKFYRNEK